MIHDLWVRLLGAWHDTSWIELTAAALAVAYLLLAIGQHVSCWLAAFASSCLYVWVFFEARLYMDGVLNGFFALMAVYGYQQWRRGEHDADPPVARWPALVHFAALMTVLLLACATSWLLRRYTAAALPFFDSLEMWASVWTTFLVARKIYENWHWWLAIDSLSVVLYYVRGLYVTMLLYGVYLVLIVIGMREWRRAVVATDAAA